MPSARLLSKRYWGVVILVVSLVKPTPVAATAHQMCTQGSDCVVGEFVYADDATPNASASCQLTSFTPQGASFLNAVPVTGTVDAWYGHTISLTPSDAVGAYPTQMCCTTAEGNICIDKTFDVSLPGATPIPGITQDQVAQAVWNATSSSFVNPGTTGQHLNTLQNNTLQASDIWSYTNRSLSSFGSLVSDTINGVWNAHPGDYTDPNSIGQKVGSSVGLSASDVWGYSNRSLSSFGDITTSIWNYQDRSLNSYDALVSSIWANPTRLVTNSFPTATSSADLTELTREVKASRDLIDQLVNAPTVSTYLDSDPAPKLDSKIRSTKDFTAQIATNMELASTKVGLVTLKWSELSDTDRNQQIQQAISLLGANESENPKTIIGQLNWLVTAWDKPITHDIYDNTVSLRDDLSAFLTTLQASPASNDQLTYMNSLYARFTSIKVSIGDVSQTENDPTLFGMVKTLSNIADQLTNQEHALNAAIADWDKTPPTVQNGLVTALSSALSKLNQLPALLTLLSPLTPSKEFLGNLSALINLNRAVLASSTSDAISGTWISADPIRFRTLVHNPSKRVKQTAKINYLLPAELTQEQISGTAPEFTVTYDPSAKALRVTGNVDLEPGESKLIDLTTNDIWEIRSEDIDKLKKQTDELIKPLENSSSYTEATTIKSTIDVALDTITALKEKASTPTGKIHAFHQSQLLFSQVDRELNRLRDLVGRNQSNNSLMGFIGGTQAIAVWGIIIIFIAGFVFLSIYMRALYQSTIHEPATAATLTLPLTGPSISVQPVPTTYSGPSFELPNLSFLTGRHFNLTVTILCSLLITTMLVRQIPIGKPQHPAIIPISPLTPTAPPSPSPTLSPTLHSTLDTSHSVLITPSNAASLVNVRENPTTASEKIAEVTTEETAEQLDISGDWYQVKLIEHNPVVTGWIHKEYIQPIK